MNSHPQLQRPTKHSGFDLFISFHNEPDGSKWVEKTDHGLVTYLPQLIKWRAPDHHRSIPCLFHATNRPLPPTNPLHYIFFFLGVLQQKRIQLLNEWMNERLLCRVQNGDVKKRRRRRRRVHWWLIVERVAHALRPVSNQLWPHHTYMVSANLIITELNRSYRTTNIVVPIMVLVLIRFCTRICSKDTHTPNTQHPLSFFIIIIIIFKCLSQPCSDTWKKNKNKNKRLPWMGPSRKKKTSIHTQTHTHTHPHTQFTIQIQSKVDGGKIFMWVVDRCMREVVVESVIPTQPNS
jgi:hypothetical protein